MKIEYVEDKKKIREFFCSWFGTSVSVTGKCFRKSRLAKKERNAIKPKLKKLFQELGFKNIELIKFENIKDGVLICHVIQSDGFFYELSFNLNWQEDLPSLQVESRRFSGFFEYTSKGIISNKVKYASSIEFELNTEENLVHQIREQSILIKTPDSSFDLKYKEDLNRTFAGINKIEHCASRIQCGFDIKKIYSEINALLPNLEESGFQELNFTDKQKTRLIQIKKGINDEIDVMIKITKPREMHMNLKQRNPLLNKVVFGTIITISLNKLNELYEKALKEEKIEAEMDAKKLAEINQSNQKDFYLEIGKWLGLLPKKATVLPNLEMVRKIEKVKEELSEYSCTISKECQNKKKKNNNNPFLKNIELLTNNSSEMPFIEPNLNFCVTTKNGNMKKYCTYHPEIKTAERTIKPWITEYRREIKNPSNNAFAVAEYAKESYKILMEDPKSKIEIEIDYPAYLIDTNNNIYINQKKLHDSLKKMDYQSSITDVYSAMKCSLLSEIKCYPRIYIRITKDGMICDELLLEHGIPTIFQTMKNGKTYRICSDGTEKYETAKFKYEQIDGQVQKVMKDLPKKDMEEYQKEQKRARKMSHSFLNEN